MDQAQNEHIIDQNSPTRRALCMNKFHNTAKGGKRGQRDSTCV